MITGRNTKSIVSGVKRLTDASKEMGAYDSRKRYPITEQTCKISGYSLQCYLNISKRLLMTVKIFN